jgi:hypothetical protein
LIRESVKVTFDVYWFGLPRRWFGSFAAVTVPERLAVLTCADSFANAALAVSLLLAVAGLVLWPEVDCAGPLLLQAARESSRAPVATVVRVRLIPVMVRAPVVTWGLYGEAVMMSAI